MITVTTLDNSKVDVVIVSDSVRKALIKELAGSQDNSNRKRWTARTYRLSDSRMLVEFYDGQAAIIKSKNDFDKLKEVRFVKNYIDFLKKDVTYKIDIPYQVGKELAKSATRITNLQPEMPHIFGFEVYQMQSGQILFINTTENDKFASIYANMKGVCSDNNDVLEQYYQGGEIWTEKLVAGDPLSDYDVDGHLVYPKDVPALIRNHQLSLVESKVYVNSFYGNLYRAAKGYFILIDEVNQANGAGSKMPILTVRVYANIEEVDRDRARYERTKKESGKSEHFYQQISDSYGDKFPSYTDRLIDSLPSILNFDRAQLSFDSAGMLIVDEAIRWHHSNYDRFDKWFPGVLAYYGKCYMTQKKAGEWVVRKEKSYDVWVPHLILSNNEDAFDVYDFYKDLFEWPQSIKEAGDWDGWRKRMRKEMGLDNSR